MWPLLWCRGIKSASVALSYPLLPKLSLLLSSNTARSALVGGDGSSGAESRGIVPLVDVVLVVVVVDELGVVVVGVLVAEIVVGGVVVVVVVVVVVSLRQVVPWCWRHWVRA